MPRRPYIGPSDSQANADALARRDMPYSAASEQSFRVRWDFYRREPRDLLDAARKVRHAYAEEVPPKLHEGPDSIGPDGTPKWTTRAEGYIFGVAQGSDAKRDPETGEYDALSYFHGPFRAALDNLSNGDEPERKRGMIVQHVAFGGGPAEAAIKEGVPSWCAKLVAEDALRSFLRNLSDVRVEFRRRRETAVA